MPISRKKLAAKKRIKNQVHDAATGQFIEQYSASDDEYILSNDNAYSTDSSDESYNQKVLKLGDISFVWTETDDEKRKAPYLGNSTATYYRKHGPSGIYTKAAKGSLPITQYFTKQNLASVPSLFSPNTFSSSSSFSTGNDDSSSGNDAIGDDRDDDNRNGDSDYNILQKNFPKFNQLEDSKSTQENETDIETDAETDVEYDSVNDKTEIECNSIDNHFD